jgi:hypothetical protein
MFGGAEIIGLAIQGANKGNTMAIYHKDDEICAGIDVVLAPNLTYSTNAGKVAAFVAARSKLIGDRNENGKGDGKNCGCVGSDDGTGNGCSNG